jgi:hypothetical protein
MAAEDTRNLALVIAPVFFLMGCGRSQGLGIAGKDSGATVPDGESARDLRGDDSLSPGDAAADADALTADARSDTSLDREGANRDAALFDQDVAGDVPGSTLDSAGFDMPVIDEDASLDGSTVRRDTGTDRAGLDVAADGPLACTGTFTLGGFLPMGRTGATPVSVALGDLDGDGRLDLVTANASPATVSILLGKGDGTFAAPTDYSVGLSGSVDPARLGPSMLALGDVNGDSKLDVAVAQDNSAFNGGGVVTALLGKGDGTFPTAATYAADMGPSSVALGDVNGDGKLDVVTANHDSDEVMATFGVSGEHGAWCATGHGPSTVLLGDVNADGKLDYVTVNTLASSVSVLLGRGDGTCASATETPIERDLTSLTSSAALGDMNADGKLDLAVATSSPGTVTVLLGKGDGSFTAPSDYPVGDDPVLVALRDLSGDQKLDLLVAASTAGTLGVLVGQGDGTFAAKVDIPAVQSLRSAALGDVNGDGNLDIAMAGPVLTHAGWTSVLFGTGRDTLVSRPAFPTGVDLTAMALADLNGDGKLDIAAVGSDHDSPGLASVLLGAGDGSFASPAHFATGDHPSSLALGDTNDDGKLDIVAADQDAAAVSILSGQGDGTFAAKTDYPTGDEPSSVALGDLDGDGRLDIVTAGPAARKPGIYPSAYQVKASVLLGTGGGGLAAHVDYPVNYAAEIIPQSLALGDLNGDGTLDIAVAANYLIGGDVNGLLGRGDGTFEVSRSLYGSRSPVHSVVLADLNSDGYLDLVAAFDDRGGGQGWVTVALGGSDGRFTTSDYPTGLGARSLALADLNQDGKLDVITGNTVSNGTAAPGTVSVLFGNGDGTFAPRLDYPAAAVSLALGDVDGDGRPEVVTATASGSLEVLFGACQ